MNHEFFKVENPKAEIANNKISSMNNMSRFQILDIKRLFKVSEYEIIANKRELTTNNNISTISITENQLYKIYTELQCRVCFNLFKNPVMNNECGHVFCFDCSSKFVVSNKKCPLCMKPILTKRMLHNHNKLSSLKSILFPCSFEAEKFANHYSSKIININKNNNCLKENNFYDVKEFLKEDYSDDHEFFLLNCKNDNNNNSSLRNMFNKFNKITDDLNNNNKNSNLILKANELNFLSSKREENLADKTYMNSLSNQNIIQKKINDTLKLELLQEIATTRFKLHISFNYPEEVLKVQTLNEKNSIVNNLNNNFHLSNSGLRYSDNYAKKLKEIDNNFINFNKIFETIIISLNGSETISNIVDYIKYKIFQDVNYPYIFNKFYLKNYILIKNRYKYNMVNMTVDNNGNYKVTSNVKQLSYDSKFISLNSLVENNNILNINIKSLYEISKAAFSHENLLFTRILEAQFIEKVPLINKIISGNNDILMLEIDL
jgi:hypothetical protein